MLGQLVDLKFDQVKSLVRTEVDAVAFPSSLFAKDHVNGEGAQLVNVTSVAGYQIYPDAVLYTGNKFFVTAFPEGLADEMKPHHAKLQVKLLSPNLSQSNFDKVDWNKEGVKDSTEDQVGAYCYQLLESNKTVGFVNSDQKLELFDRKAPITKVPSFIGDISHQK